jgi:hypothetical protein
MMDSKSLYGDSTEKDEMLRKADVEGRAARAKQWSTEPVNETLVEEKTAEPEVLEVQMTSRTSLMDLFDDIKANPKKYKDREVIDKMFEATKAVFDQCWDAQLPEMARELFNQVGVGFTVLTRIALARHGAYIAPPGMLDQQPPQKQEPLFKL